VTGRLLTAREVVDRLGLSVDSVLRRYRRGGLPGYRIAINCLRFDEDEIDQWLQARRVGGPCVELEVVE
jgi:excisionase family DNA binding protein